MKAQADRYRHSLERFAYWVVVYEIIVVFLYAYFVRYDHTIAEPHVQNFYPWFQDTNVLMLIGFGFTMTYINTNSWSALGWTFFINTIVFQCYPIFKGFWLRVFTIFEQPYIYLNMISLSVCNSAVAGMLISFGTVLGRLMPSQILFMSVFACFFFTLNQTIVSNILRAVDVGGSISVHIFGAYFGLALSWVLGKTNSLQGINSTFNYHSTMFSMLGTLFLWMFWPSANSGSIYWGSPHDQEIRLWTIINTLLSLTGSCIATFSMSMFFKGKIHMADVLNASLAGGVAIGSCCSIMQNSSWALVIGLIAGFISSLGFAKIGPWLSRKGLIDVCGVFNLHAMPGLFGGIAGAIVFAIYTVSAPSIVVNPSSGYDYSKQAGMQIAGTFISLGIALITGAACGLILCYFENIPAYDFFEDKVFFNIDIAEAEKRGKSDSIPNNESNMMQSSMVELKKISLDPNFCQSTEQNLN